jgi:dephospho-CoA kinase
MLRVGLTGGLGSGKSTVAGIFAGFGAHVLEADAIARTLMQPGEPVFAAIVAAFGPSVVRPDGHLDRAAIARLVFAEDKDKDKGDGDRLEELNAIVHPATIARQTELAEAIATRDPHAVVLVESALIFETKHGAQTNSPIHPSGPISAQPSIQTHANVKDRWHHRFDKIVLVTAPDELKIARFVTRIAAGRHLSDRECAALTADAERRLARQIPDDRKAALCDYVLVNDGPLKELEWQIEQLWPLLKEQA